MDHINTVLREGDPENTLLALQKPEAQLPTVYPFAAPMYQNELFNLQKQNAMVSQPPETERHGKSEETPVTETLILSPSSEERCSGKVRGSVESFTGTDPWLVGLPASLPPPPSCLN